MKIPKTMNLADFVTMLEQKKTALAKAKCIELQEMFFKTATFSFSSMVEYVEWQGMSLKRQHFPSAPQMFNVLPRWGPLKFSCSDHTHYLSPLLSQKNPCRQVWNCIVTRVHMPASAYVPKHAT